SGRAVTLIPPSTPASITRPAGHMIRTSNALPEVFQTGAPQQSYANDWRKVARLTASSSDACALSDETATRRTAGIARTFLIPHQIPSARPTASPRRRFAQLPKCGCQLRQLMIGVEAAGLG